MWTNTSRYFVVRRFVIRAVRAGTWRNGRRYVVFNNFTYFAALGATFCFFLVGTRSGSWFNFFRCAFGGIAVRYGRVTTAGGLSRSFGKGRNSRGGSGLKTEGCRLCNGIET